MIPLLPLKLEHAIREVAAQFERRRRLQGRLIFGAVFFGFADWVVRCGGFCRSRACNCAGSDISPSGLWRGLQVVVCTTAGGGDARADRAFSRCTSSRA